ncbi:MAG: hypothetical protein ACRENP_17715 [Longimicrobiales bacterium]
MVNAILTEVSTLALPIVDACHLDHARRAILRPDELVPDRAGKLRRLPRFFYEVESWQMALETPLTEHFELWEFMGVDVREAQPMRIFPRYVPCAVTLLAVHLELLRQSLGTFIHIAANGGYRSPAHNLTDHASTHCWGTAANIYRIGDDVLDNEEKIDRYTRLVNRCLISAWVRPFGHNQGQADDHLHIDIGYVLVTPRAADSDRGSA